jgi:hypothetical protein
MRKKTIIGLAIATILTAYMSVLPLSNQALAGQAQILGNPTYKAVQEAQLGNNHVLATQPGQDRVPHVGGNPLGESPAQYLAKILGSHTGLLGGIGFGIGAITKFKAHKENPIQITSGIGVLHKFTP